MAPLKHIRTVAILTAILLTPMALAPRAQQTVIRSVEWDGAEKPAARPATIIEHGRLESVLGRAVQTRVEEDGGRIIDLLADRSGKVVAAVIEFGGFLGIGTRKIAVEWPALRFAPDRGQAPQSPIVVDVTRDQLRVAPEYKPNEPAIVRRASN